jgi:aminoglycoside N3'-acetyltransferase
MDPISREELVRQLRSVGVEPGDVLLVHTSFRAVGPVEGGPEGLITALLEAVGAAGTLVMPSWSGEDDEIFDPARSETDVDLGILPRLFWKRPGAVRSDHPHAFAALGPAAREILRDPLPLPPHIPESPVGRVHDLDGRILLLGVDHDADTTVHLAELVGGAPYRVPKHCTVLRDGRPTRVEYGENDHCCAGFRLVGGWLRQAGSQGEGRVGHGIARTARSRDVVATVVAHLGRDPLVFLHPPESGCPDCDAARASTDAT